MRILTRLPHIRLSKALAVATALLVLPSVLGGCTPFRYGTGGEYAPESHDYLLADIGSAYESCVAMCSQPTSLALVTREGCLDACASFRNSAPLADETFRSRESCAEAAARAATQKNDHKQNARAWCDERWSHIHNRKGCYNAADYFFDAMTPERLCGTTYTAPPAPAETAPPVVNVETPAPSDADAKATPPAQQEPLDTPPATDTKPATQPGTQQSADPAPVLPAIHDTPKYQTPAGKPKAKAAETQAGTQTGKPAVKATTQQPKTPTAPAKKPATGTKTATKPAAKPTAKPPAKPATKPSTPAAQPPAPKAPKAPTSPPASSAAPAQQSPTIPVVGLPEGGSSATDTRTAPQSGSAVQPRPVPQPTEPAPSVSAPSTSGASAPGSPSSYSGAPPVNRPSVVLPGQGQTSARPSTGGQSSSTPRQVLPPQPAQPPSTQTPPARFPSATQPSSQSGSQQSQTRQESSGDSAASTLPPAPSMLHQPYKVPTIITP